MQYSPDNTMDNLREYFANRNKPKQPSAETLARQEADREFFAGLDRHRKAEEAKRMNDLAQVFANRAAARRAERAAQ
ncbi:MAG: hypothetical protein OHM77_04705 [Candidatus Nitricoxidivorans perseverans]|uniref:Uncharacterized protein n=1 Tax=Candidatus Nitricoxidivorans perseverans TaxID=2975601 RepID=A0AA49IZK0_9PROT|nr:MAG: hypothetical protein OHM77_04705 [Candidatus Nitricoxidivorans perseverans]